MAKIFPLFIAICIWTAAPAQLSVDSIRVNEAKAILHFLASDSLRGRGNYTHELTTAAGFIASRFEAAGLHFFPGLDSYFHSFTAKELLPNAGDSAKSPLQNVVGVLEGRSKATEVVMFCAHYDHLGTEGKTIYNGANDNASGTTALLLLADYFARRADNERTLLFCAFAGEELGLLGSEAFATFIKPEAVVAVINIEMIGIPAVGKNAFFITGTDYSDFGEIFRKNLPKPYKIRHEPDESKELFRRSDNFPFAKKGIPAHTLMASDDDDGCYHRPCDDEKRIDVVNLTNLTRAIVLGCETLVNGKDTPERVKAGRWW
jgi:hypothetical protein